MNSVLKGICVLDISTLIAGPYCAMILGVMGAEVIKVEHPEGGDPARAMGPPYVKGQSALSLSVNLNKKSLTLDLNQKKGKEIFGKLLANSQVIVENFRPDIVENLGLDYETLSKERPDIVYCAITGFGEKGPYRMKAGTDTIFQGMGGIMTISGEPGDPPLRLGVPIADMTTGIYAALGVMMALYHRAETGQGQKVEISLLDSLIALQAPRMMEYFVTGENPVLTGRSSPFGAPIQFFETKDGYINISVFLDKFWRKLCQALEIEHLTFDPKFAKNADRMQNRKELEKILSEIFLKRTTAEWQAILNKFDVPNGPINTYKEVFHDPQVQHNRIYQELAHEILGSYRYLGLPFHLTNTPGVLKSPPPLPGEHNEEILTKLGYTKKEVEKLKKEKII